MSTRTRRPSRPILIADAGFTSQSSQHAKVLERLLDGQLPFRRAGLHALLTLPVGRLGYGQTIDFLAVRNPAGLRLEPIMLQHPLLNLLVCCHRAHSMRLSCLGLNIARGVQGVCLESTLLQRGWLLLTRVGQALLNPAREFFLPAELDLRVFLRHAHCGRQSSTLRCSTRLPPAAT